MQINQGSRGQQLCIGVMSKILFIILFSSTFLVSVGGIALLVLYRPKDVSHDCVFSQQLRYDLSFGMGMSDTITLVFRTLTTTDYECMVEIVAESDSTHLVIVIKFPNLIQYNCNLNDDAFTVIKKNQCFRVCDYVENKDLLSAYYVLTVNGRFRFRYASNSSINADMNTYMYQVTATASRLKPTDGCSEKNETICGVNSEEYCFTSGVVCDGIKNCGVNDWYDERQSECGKMMERLSISPVLTVTAAMICLLVAATHILLQCLQPLANSFFIFNANEDNRLYVSPLLKPTEHVPDELQQVKRASLIPTFSSTSSETESEKQSENIARELRNLSIVGQDLSPEQAKQPHQDTTRRTTTMTSMKTKLQETLRAVTRAKNKSKPPQGPFVI